MICTPDCDGLLVWDDDGGANPLREIVVWEGQSPRGLTRARLAVILKAQAEKSMGEFERSHRLLEQLEREKGPRYAGAPTLVPLPLRGV